MKLYISQGTNPKVVEYFLQQKRVEIEKQWIDIAKGENLTEDYLRKNPLGQMPVLELDSGQCISQITAICEYLEELYPEPSLLGNSPELRAETRMWLRRIDQLILEPLVSGFKYAEGLSYYQSRIYCIPQAAAELKVLAKHNLAWLEQQLRDQPYICGERFSLADIVLFCFLEFAEHAGQPLDQHNLKILSWMELVRSKLDRGN